MQREVLRLRTVKLFKPSPRDADALGGACFPKDNLPGLRGAWVSSAERCFRQTSGVRGVERAQRAQVPLDKPQPTRFFVRKVLGALPLFIWRLLSWHPATGSSNSCWHRVSSDRVFSLPSVSVPFFFSPPSSDRCLDRLVQEHAM